MAIKINKIPAFTLAEVLVAIVVTSIVVVLSFSALSMLQKQMGLLQNGLSRHYSIHQISRTMWHDFNRFESIRIEQPNELSLRSFNDSIRYQFKDSTLVLDDQIVSLKIDSVKYYRLGKMVQQGQVDAVELFLANPYGQTPVFIYQNPSVQLEFFELWE